jgi:anti-sigma-K factor RskA
VAFTNAAGSLQVNGNAARLTTWTLGPAPSGHAYEVWVMRPGTAPRSVGLMADVTPLTIDDVRAGDQIGVTIEPAAGSPGPTTDPVALANIA